MFPILAVAGLASGLISGISGAIQKGKANRLLKNLQYPNETIPTEVLQNQELARLRANTGLPGQQYSQAKQNIARSQTSALSKLTDRRSGLMGIAATQQAADDALLNLDVADATARIGNERALMDANNNVAGWRDKVWTHNVKDKYNRDYDYGMSLKGAGNQNFVSGIDKIASGGLYATQGGWQGFMGGVSGGNAATAQTGFIPNELSEYQRMSKFYIPK